jgi:hypothetical protein
MKTVYKDFKIDYIDIEIIFLNFIIYEEIYIIPIKYLKRVFLKLKYKNLYIRL